MRMSVEPKYSTIRSLLVFFFSLIYLLFGHYELSAGDSIHFGETIKNVRAEGSCAIVGMSSEQSKLLALQRARAAAIEQAAGISISSTTLVTNSTLSLDIIKSYAKGFIVRERVNWQPLGQYQKDSSNAPIPEYRVKIEADVYIPKNKSNTKYLEAKLNKTVFNDGEKAVITVKVKKVANIGVFNIQADDKIVFLYPNNYDHINGIMPDEEKTIPSKESPIEFEVKPLPGHQKDAEAYLIIAVDHTINLMDKFNSLEPYEFAKFFSLFSEIAESAEDLILPYEVHAGSK
jgi:hypothetical protein